MAISSEALTTKVTTGSPYQLSIEQVTRASTALLRHIKDVEKERSQQSTKKNLLVDDDGSDSEAGFSGDDIPVWLVLTTKKHIVDKNRLKPGKIPVPHSLYTSESLRICLITADPQRAVKDVVADPSFPKSLSSRTTKIIGYSKLKDRYKSFESRRQLLAEHDVFLADDRIIMRLIQTLGKTFFKSSKRPIPIRIEEIQKVNGKRLKKEEKKRPPPDEKYAAVASPEVVAKEIERTLNTVPVHLAPATTAAVKVGLAGFTPEQLSQNIQAVVAGMADKYVTKGWRNIKAIHIKGPNTMAMPIWLASELWLDEEDVRDNTDGEETKAIKGAKESGKKRKSTGDVEDGKKAKRAKSTGDTDEDADLIASRRRKLQDQKVKALSEGAADLIKVTTAASDASVKPTKKKKKSAT
ncbi:hypothetical protein VTO42DRAFT_1055 [Malbranchea cinnamomea]